jgi:hypothetical protein
LPKIAYHLLPSNQRQVIFVTAGERGYSLFSVPFETPAFAAGYADMANGKLGISHAERDAMVFRSMSEKSTASAERFPNAGSLAEAVAIADEPARSAQSAGDAARGAAATIAPFPALTGRTLHTVLAALRIVQSQPTMLHRRDIAPVATNEGTEKPLDGDEIDDLCEAWNTGTLQITVVIRGGLPSVYANSAGVNVTVLDFDHFETCGCDPSTGEHNPDCTDHESEQVAEFAADLKHVNAGTLAMVW